MFSSVSLSSISDGLTKSILFNTRISLLLGTSNFDSVSRELFSFFSMDVMSSLKSRTSKITSAKFNSDSVDLNASIIYGGSLLMNPIVPVNNTFFSLITADLVYVVSVVNNCLLVSFFSFVIQLNNDVFPAEVYPVKDIRGVFSLSLWTLWSFLFFSSTNSFF